MSILGWIIVTALAGGVLSMLAAAAFALSARASWVPALLSYAIGALLGAAFLEILPEAFSGQGATHTRAIGATVLFGILAFFILEKLVLWRHCHGGECEAHTPAPQHDHGRTGMMILIGDTFHNFVDGIIIAAAFLVDVKTGLVTAIAIIAHEIPQEVGDFLVLLHSGFSKKRALLFNLLSSVATAVGAGIAYVALSPLNQWSPYLLALAAASMIYVSVADLIPGLHKRPELHVTLQQVALILLGIGSIWVTQLLIGEA